MSTERGIFYDADGIIRKVMRGSGRVPLANQKAEGLTLLAVAPDHDVLARPGRWKVVSGALVQKAAVTLSVSGSTVSATPSATATLQLPNGQIVLANGDATLSTPPQVGWQIHIAHDDPNYYSDPLIVS